MQTHGMLKRMLSLGWEVFARPRDVRYTASPLFHIAGWALVFEQVSVGCTSFIEPQFDPAVTAKAIADGLLTGCFLVPTMIQAVLDADTGPTGRERLDTMPYGSAPMPPSLLKRALERYPDRGFWNMFGAGTESARPALAHRAAGARWRGGSTCWRRRASRSSTSTCGSWTTRATRCLPLRWATSRRAPTA